MSASSRRILCWAGQSLHTIAPGISEHAFLILIAVVSVIATIFGHDLIHAYARILTYVSGAALLLTLVWMVFVHGLPGGDDAHECFLARRVLL